MLGPPLIATQIAPGVAAMPSGWDPTGTVATTALVAGSMRRTTLSETRAIQTAPFPAAASPQLPGRSGQGLFSGSFVRAVTAFRIGSIRVSMETASLVDHTAPSPTAKPPEFAGIGILA